MNSTGALIKHPRSGVVLCLLTCTVLAAFGPVQAADVNARLGAVTGAVLLDGQPAPAKLPADVKIGQTLACPEKSSAILAPLAGQVVFVHGGEVKLRACEFNPGPPAFRSSVVEQLSGYVHCSISHPPKGGASHLKVITAKGSLEAHGTSWSSRLTAAGLEAAVFSGTVTSIFGGISVSLQPGQVATLTGSGANQQVLVVDLKTGAATTYATGGGAPQTSLATFQQIGQAAGSFSQGVAAFLSAASATERAQFTTVLAQVNQTFSSNSFTGTQQTQLLAVLAEINQTVTTAPPPPPPPVPGPAPLPVASPEQPAI